MNQCRRREGERLVLEAMIRKMMRMKKLKYLKRIINTPRL
jgi:hypothetical protein